MNRGTIRVGTTIDWRLIISQGAKGDPGTAVANPEEIRNAAVTALLPGANITLAKDTTAGTVTINSTGGGNGGGGDPLTSYVDQVETLPDYPNSFPPAAHGHVWDDISELPIAYPPAEHGHVMADVAGLPEALADTYRKGETYSRAEVDALAVADPLATVPTFRVLDFGEEPAPTDPDGLYFVLAEGSTTTPPGVSTIVRVGSSTSPDTGTSPATVSAAIPPGTQPGDLMLAAWSTSKGALSYTLSGWTLVATKDHTNTNTSSRLYRRVATASDVPGSTVAATVDSAGANRQNLALVSYRGATTIDGFASREVTTAATAHALPALTTTAAQCAAVYVGVIRDSTVPIPTWTAPAGITEITEAANTGNSGKNTGLFEDLDQVSAGTEVGGATLTSSSATTSILWTLALKPAGVA